MLEMGAYNVAIYKSDAVYVATATEEGFSFQLKAANIVGPASSAAIVGLPDGQHVYLGIDGNLYAFDGASVREVSPAIGAYIVETADMYLIERSFLFYDRTNAVLAVFYVGLGAELPRLALFLDVRGGFVVWPMRFPNNWITTGGFTTLPSGTNWEDVPGYFEDCDMKFEDFLKLTPVSVLGDSSGWFNLLSGPDYNGEDIPAYFETGLFIPGQALDRYKLLQVVEQFWATSGTMAGTIQVGVTEFWERRVLGAARAFTVNQGRCETHHRDPGRAFSLRMNVDVDKLAEFEGAMVFFSVRGNR